MNHEKQVLCWRTRSGPQKRHGNERERRERERESTDVHPPFASFKWGFPSWGGWPHYIHPMFWPCASAPRLGWSDPFEVHSAFPDLTPMEPRVTLVAWLIDHSVISPGTPQATFFVKKDWMIWMRHHLAVEAFDIPLLWRLVSLVHKSEKSLQINHIYNPHIPHLQSKTRQLCDWHFLVFQVCV